MEMQIERLEDEFLALKVDLEEAIIERQRARGDLAEIPAYMLVINEHSVPSRAMSRPGVVGWVDDL